MARRKQPDNTLEFVCTIIVLIPVGIYYAIKWIVTGIAFLISRSIVYFQSRNFDKDIDLSKIDGMDGLSFEQFTARLLKANGFSNVQVTQASGDFGVDVLGKKDGELWAFQCKCYQSSVGVHAVQEVYSGAKKYGAQKAAVITNAYFTAAAREMASDLCVSLLDRDKLGCLIGNNSRCIDVMPVLPSTAESNLSVVPSSFEEEKTQTFSYDQGITTNKNTQKEDFTMATIIGAGKYTFGEDIPQGKYNLKVVSGNGMLIIRDGRTEDDETWINMGINPEYAKEYHNLSLKSGYYFSLDGNLQVEITQSKMLQIDP